MNTLSPREKRLTALIVLTLCFIWGNSLMPGTLSGRFSDWVGHILGSLLGGTLDTTSGHGVLRKLAHGTEYLVLSLEVTTLLRLWRRRPWSLPLLFGTWTALADETIQLFVAGRTGQVRDVWIDLGGFCTGMLLCLALSAWRRSRSPS